LKYIAGLGVCGVNNAGQALDKALGVPVWGFMRSAVSKGADLLDVTLGALQSGEWTPV
jgi:hypothetical protein